MSKPPRIRSIEQAARLALLVLGIVVAAHGVLRGDLLGTAWLVAGAIILVTSAVIPRLIRLRIGNRFSVEIQPPEPLGLIQIREVRESHTAVVDLPAGTAGPDSLSAT